MPEISIKAEELFRVAGWPVTNSVILAFLTVMFLVGIGILLRRRLALVPGKLQNMAETLRPPPPQQFRKLSFPPLRRFAPRKPSVPGARFARCLPKRRNAAAFPRPLFGIVGSYRFLHYCNPLVRRFCILSFDFPVYNESVTTLIKNGLVYDGSGKVPEKKDILICGKRISRVGNLSHRNVETVIDANGSAVTPGFIDVSSEADHHLNIFYEPLQEQYLRQGVTTALVGNCGVSLAPLFHTFQYITGRWRNEVDVNLGWESVAEFLDALERIKTGINFGTLVGHATLLSALLGRKFRDLTEREMLSLEKMLTRALEQGAFGVSVRLFHPSWMPPQGELRALLKIAALHRRVATLCAEGGTEMLLVDALRIAEETVADVIVSHFGRGEDISGGIGELIARGNGRVLLDIQPSGTNEIPLEALLPRWAQDEEKSVMLQYLREEHARGAIRDYCSRFAEDELLITRVEDGSLRFLKGRYLARLAENQGVNQAEAIVKLMQITRFGATILRRQKNAPRLGAKLQNPCALISSGQVGDALTFPDFLKHASKDKNVSFEEVIAKMTSVPARKFGIRERGVIREGSCADLVILGADYAPRYVFVNGVMAVRDGICDTRARAGMALRATT